MGRTIKASLVYGFDLGGSDSGWTFREVYGDDEDRYGPKLDWYDEDGDDLAAQAMERLIAAAGFTETDWRADGYYDRRRAFEKQLGVEFEHTGWEGDDLLLIAQHKDFSAYVGDVQSIDPAALTAAAGAEADGRLAAALQVLGITPSEDKPDWLLTVYYG